ncbi:EAL and HDOD domain-containing protein [Desulfospira joergensenii]|uniref:EAL and HDOD domain-containing protein n=1 Tax=Desulfospira joergensenii TaxID=53329 RepID=UPI0003B64DA7|nr:HDOD domain-containing protein [Desulfospira joergensenii]
MDIYVARQPVFTADKKIFSYELLFRLGFENVFPDVDGDTATSNVLTNTFFSFGLDEILGGKPGLINFTRELILQRIPLFFPKEHIIIEVLEDIEPEPEVIQALQEFKEQGFRIALDDFVYHEKFKPMLELCDIIKFDLMMTPLDTLGPLVERLKAVYPVTLLAEKIETHQKFVQARDMGFELFQGYFFARPEILSQKEISTNQITKFKLIDQAGRTDPDLAQLENLIKRDVSVSFKLLKFMNSAYFLRPAPIDTIKEAILVLGINELRKFISLVVLSDLNDNKPSELVRLAMIRARMCEQCGTVLRTRFSTEELFTIGLFSSIDAILDMPMYMILEQLSFSEKITHALLGFDKQFRQILALVIGFEKGNWDHRLFHLYQGKKILSKLPEFYREAVFMADSFFT